MNSMTDNAVTEASIADLLQQNPEFFERHAEMLRDKIKALEHRIIEMMRNGRENAAIVNIRIVGPARGGID